jgi:NADH-quinone oxidoreductase subunit L
VIHAVHSNNMSEMGGLRKPMPITFWTYLIGSLALAGIPPLSGFFSKDELIVAAYHDQTYWLMVVLLVGAAITAFYTTRMVALTFFGEYRGHGHPHESPPSMIGPLVALAAATVGVGYLGFAFTGAPIFDWVFLVEPEEVEFVGWIAGLSVLAAALGIAFAWRLYAERRDRDPLTALGPAYRLLEQKYYLDDVYWKGIVRPIRDPIAAGVYWSNQKILDGIVNGAGLFTRGMAAIVGWFDRVVVDGIVNAIGDTAGTSGGLLRYLQSGNVQWYAVLLFVGVIAVTIVFIRFA